MPAIHRSHSLHKRHIRNFHNMAASIERLRSTDLTEMVPVREQHELCVDKVPGEIPWFNKSRSATVAAMAAS